MKEVLLILVGVLLLAMIVWDWGGKPNAVILPATDDDDDDWKDWPHAL
jgi:hypothetical protein